MGTAKLQKTSSQIFLTANKFQAEIFQATVWGME